ncbi:MAG: glycosyltransferase family 4 protein [Candidatus Promineifilaceae bacterium]
MRLAYPLNIESFFANAGQAAAERALFAALLQRRVAFRLLTQGGPESQERLAAYCGQLAAAGQVEIVALPAGPATATLAGIDGLLLHSLPWEQTWDWVTGQRAVTRVPTVQYVHSLLLADFELRLWPELWCDWHGRPPARIVAPSRSTAGRAASIRGVPPVEVIAHGVDLPAGDRQRGRRLLGLDDESLLILSLGRISHEKADYRQLLVCFRSLLGQAARPAAKLVIAGAVARQDKGYYQHLRSLAGRLGLRGRVTFIENLEEADKPHLLYAADIFVSLANNPQESFGIALLEALAAGLPVIATNWDGYREVLPVRFHELMVPTVASHRVALASEWTRVSEACAPDYSALATQLERLMADAALRRELGAAGRAHAAGFNWSQVAAQIVSLFERLDEAFKRGRPPGAGAAPAAGQPLRSMVDGLASCYLDDNTRLRPAASRRSPARRSPALPLISCRPPDSAFHPKPPGSDERALARFGRYLRRLAGDERTNYLWSTRSDKALLARLLDHCQAAGPAGMPVYQLRAVYDLPVAQFDWIALQMIRYGLLEIAPS